MKALIEKFLGADFIVVLAIVSIPLLLLALVLAWRHRCWASPWPGIGDDLESFEDLLAGLRLVAFPAALAALLIAGGFLTSRAWQGSFFAAPQPGPCANPAPVQSEGQASRPACSNLVPDGNLGAAVEGLTKAVTGAVAKLDAAGASEIARTLQAIEKTLTAIDTTMAKAGPTSAALLDRLDGLSARLQAVAEAAGKPATPELVDRLDAIGKALHAIAEKSPPELLERLDKLQAGLSELTVAAGKPAPVASPQLLEHLDALERALRAIPASLPKPDSTPADLLDRLEKLRAGLQAVAKAVSNPAAPQWTEQLGAIEKDLHAVAEKSGSTSPELLDRLDKLQAALAALTNAAARPAPVAPPQLLERLDALERALRAVPTLSIKPDSTPADLLDRLDKLLAAVRPLADLPGLPPRLDAIEKELHRIADSASGQPGILPASQLDAIVKILTAIEISVENRDKGGNIDDVIEHLTLIEAILSDLPHPSPTPCGPIPGFAPLGEPTPGERGLMDLAKRRGLTPARQYRVAKRQIFFDPQANQPSQIGMRLLRLTADDARKRGLAVAIRAEADTISDGANAEAMARRRAAAIVEYLALHAPVPVVGIGLATPVGAASEPYRRIVRIDLLEPCTGPAMRERAPAGLRTR